MSRRRSRLALVVLLAVVSPAVSGCFSISDRLTRSRLEGARLFDLEGRPFDVAALAGKPLFVNVWATWCGPCIREMPSIEKLRVELDPAGIEFLLLADEPLPTLQRFVARNGAEWRSTVVQRELLLGMLGGAMSFPQTYVFDAEGRTALYVSGAREWSSPEMVARVRRAALGEG
jgi:thiol-disulfide isomerase/thioredoxin